MLRRQDGVVTRGQALEHLLATPVKRLLRDGVLTPVTPGVYRLPTTPDAAARAWAGHLIGGAGSAVGGWMALHLAGLADPPRVVETWTPPERCSVRPRPGWSFRRDGEDRLRRTRGTLPCILTETALVDVGADLGLDRWTALVLDAVRERRVSIDRVHAVLGRRRRGRERATRLALLGDLLGLESDLELRYARDVERAHGLPPGERQASVTAGTRTDVRYPGLATLIELDGRRGHDGADAFRDLDRDNRHAIRGLTTLRYGSLDVRGRPCAVAWQVGVRLATRGWPGPFRRCPRCPSPAHLRAAATAGGWTLPPGLLNDCRIPTT